MGTELFDKYSLAHAGFGTLAAQSGIPFIIWMLMHIIFEFAENSQFGMYIINEYFMPVWIGPKDQADTTTNMWGDNISTAIGYWIGMYFRDSQRQG